MVFLHIKNEVTGDRETWDMTDPTQLQEFAQAYPAADAILRSGERDEGLRAVVRYFNSHHMHAWMSDEQAP